MSFIRTFAAASLAVFTASVVSAAPNGAADANKFQSFQSESTARLAEKPLLGLYWANSIARQVNVASVDHPSTCIFCVHAQVPLNRDKIFPVVTPEWGGSAGNGLLAYAEEDPSKNDGCKSGTTVEVRTYNFSSGTIVASDSVLFYLIIP